jgi:hypothetical protein
MEVWLEAEPNLDRLYVSIALTIFFLPLPHLSADMRGRAINTEFCRRIPQCAVLLSHGSVAAQWFSLYHQLHHRYHLLLQHHLRKSKSTLFEAITIPFYK